MKSFFKSVFATIVGVLISSFIIGCFMFLFLLGLFAIGSSGDNYVPQENSILKINLSGIMKDRTYSNPILSFLDLSEDTDISLTETLAAIRKAKTNNNIKGIYIYSGYLSASSASLNELRDELLDFKKHGKFIISYADTYLQGGYFLSSVSDKVIVNPEGMVDLHGISANLMFFKGTLDKLGIDVQVFKVGTYKSAVEPYINSKMSEANKQQITSYINSIWSTLLSEISSSRGISVDKLNALTNEMPAFQTTDFLKENNLVDTLMYESEVKEYLKTLVNIANSKDLQIASVADMNMIKNKESKEQKKNKIAILYAEGTIVSGNTKEDISDGYLIKQIQKIADNDKIKGVVFRVNSPGGSAFASEQIWKAITDLKAKKPVYVSMGDYAASGGYYISCNATKIYAQPTTLTGSIGIFGIFPNIEGLTQKIGLTFSTVKTNTFADFGDINRPMRDDEKRILQAYIERGYDLFLTRCSEGRHIPKEKLDSIAQGRVWTGNQALKLGLVDKLGGIDNAIVDLANELSLSDFSIAEYPTPPSPFDFLLSTGKEEIAAYLINEYLGTDVKLLKSIKDIKNLKETDFIQARMPYEISIK